MFFFCLADPSESFDDLNWLKLIGTTVVLSIFEFEFESEFDSAGVNEVEERGSVVDKEDEEEDEEEEEEEEEGDEEEENPSPLIPK